MKVVTYSYTAIGARRKNEDFAGHSPKRFGRAAWLVADGVGGGPGGAQASRGAVKTLVRMWEKKPRLTVDRISSMFEVTNRLMRKHSLHDEGVRGMRTTVAALFYRFGHVISAHVGDSRVYLFRRGAVRYQSRDHRAEKTSPRDVARLNRVLGDAQEYLPELSEKMKVRRGDAFLLCTDGFWENLTETEILRALRQSKSPREWVARMLTQHAKRVVENQDNTTVVAGFFK